MSTLHFMATVEHVILITHKNWNAKKINIFLGSFKLSDVAIIMLRNLKKQTIVCIFNIYKHDQFHAQLN